MSPARARLIAALSCWSLAIGALARLRTQHDVLLPPPLPLAWLLTGFVQDVAILAFAAALTLLIARWRPMERIATIAFGAFVVVVTLLQIVRSEAVVFYGEVIRPEDLHGDVPIAVALRSLTGVPRMLFVISIVLLAFTFFMVWRAKAQRTIHLRLGWIVTTGCVATVLALFLGHIVPRSGLARNPIVALWAIEHELMESPHTRFEVAAPTMPVTSIRKFAPTSENRDSINPAYPLAYTAKPHNELAAIGPKIKPNIIFFLMESVRAEEVGCYVADPPGVTPNIDALARMGIRFDPAYSSGTYTASAELALWYGLPPIPREVLMTSRPSASLLGLPEILRAEGWRTLLWIHSGDSNFYRRDSFYIPRGVQVIDGRSFPLTDPTTNWGYSDRALARNAITALDRAQQPFAAMVLTVTNHHPFQLPSDADPPMALPPPSEAIRRARTEDMIQTIHYTDEALGDFVREARKRPWFSHSILIVTGDHGTSIPPLQKTIATKEDLLGLHNRVPLIIYSPMLPGGIVVHGPASHIDILPTLLNLIQFPVSTGLGVDLFDRNAVETRVLPVWNGHQRMLTLATPTRVYHAVYRAAEPPETQMPTETLIDPVRDPGGLQDLASREPNVLARFHELARIYVTVYPWLIVHGNSSLPPSALEKRVPGAPRVLAMAR